MLSQLSGYQLKPSKFGQIIYQRIRDSYNVCLLSSLYGNDYNIVKELLMDKNYTFQKLIQNFEQLEANQLEIPRFLSGPNTFYHLTHRLKTIYLIGEQHTDEFDCDRYALETGNTFFDYKQQKLVDYDFDTAYDMEKAGLGAHFSSVNIRDFVQNLADLPSFIDFYLEKDPYEYLEYKKQNEINGIEGSILDIARILKSNEMCRLHLTDIRGLHRNAYIDFKSYRDPALDFVTSMEVLLFGRNNEVKSKYLTIFQNNYRYLFDPNLPEVLWRDRIIEHVLSKKLLQKELERSYLGKVILSHYMKLIENSEFLTYRNEYNGWYNTIMNMKIPLNRDERNIINILSSQYIFLDSFCFDMYTLARIFKKFQGYHFDTPDEPKNVIVYAGKTHIDNIKAFLTDALKFDLTNGVRISENCVYTGLKTHLFCS